MSLNRAPFNFPQGCLRLSSVSNGGRARLVAFLVILALKQSFDAIVELKSAHALAAPLIPSQGRRRVAKKIAQTVLGGERQAPIHMSRSRKLNTQSSKLV